MTGPGGINQQLTSKERVQTTLQFEEPDRVPIGEYAIDFDTVEKIVGHETYLRAKAKSQIAFWEGRHDEVADSYVKDHIELHRKLDLDIVNLSADATWYISPPSDDPPPRKTADNTWEDKYGRVYKYSEVTADITCVKDPVAAQRQFSVADFSSEPQKPTRNERSWEILDQTISEFAGEKFICGPSGGEVGIVFLGDGFGVGGGAMEKGLIALIEQPEVVRAATDYLVKQQNLADEVTIHPGQDAVLWGIDFGQKSSPFISPEMFKDLFLEANKERVARIHSRGLKVIKHSCGNNASLLDYFVEIGYDCYESIQPTAGMDICAVKNSHGDKLALWGGVAVENLVSGTPEDVRQDVRRAMQCAKPGGGFILGSSHSIAVGSKYDNFMAMLDEHRRLADY